MPPWLRRWVEPRPGPLILLVCVVGVAAVGFTDFVNLSAALAVALVLALAAMTLREWSFLERQRDANDFNRLLSGLDRATAGSHADYTEDVDQIWFVDREGQDRGLIRYRTWVTPGDSMAWRRVKVFATTPRQPSVRTMRLVAKEEGEEIEAFRVKEGGGFVDYVVFFSRPISAGDNGREWSIEFAWPGMWDELRDRGEDQCSLDFTQPAETASIRLVFPRGEPEAPSQFLRRHPRRGTQTAEEYDGSPSLLWRFGPCGPGNTYRADVRARLRRG